MSALPMPRVLLVEDDPSVARFVGLAIEDLAIQLTVCSDVAGAVQALAASPYALIITDLMLPGESGIGLLQRLHAQPSLRNEALIAVFSAGLNTETRAELAAYPVWRLLPKPVSVTVLVACVEEALQQGLASRATPHSEMRSTALATPSAEEDAIRLHFAGDADLFHEYRRACRIQFASDIAAGDGAVATGDWQTLHRLAHSLKTVLLTLGMAEVGQLAAELERHAAAGNVECAHTGWKQLRQHLS